MAYATAADLKDYVGESLALPSEPEQDRLLARASEIVAAATLDRIDPEQAEQADAARRATCAQVEYWLTTQSQADTTPPVQSYTLGSLSMTFGQGKNAQQLLLAPRARRHLFLAGLLYRGVGTR